MKKIKKELLGIDRLGWQHSGSPTPNSGDLHHQAEKLLVNDADRQELSGGNLQNVMGRLPEYSVSL